MAAKTRSMLAKVINNGDKNEKYGGNGGKNEKYGGKNEKHRRLAKMRSMPAKMRSMAAKMIKYGGGGKNEKYADKIIEKYGGKLLYINWRQKFHESGK